MLVWIFYYFGWVVMKIVSKLMFKMDIVYQEPMPKGPKILVANHPTTSDPFIMITTTSSQISIIVKSILLTIPVFGKYLKLSGHIPMILGQGQTAFDTALKYLKKGISVLVFIEGKISPEEGGYYEPHTGTVRLAYQSGVPIIPIGIAVKTKNIIYMKKGIPGIDEPGRWYFHGPYTITVGKSFRMTGEINDRTQIKWLSSQVMEQVIILAEESIKRISKERVPS